MASYVSIERAGSTRNGSTTKWTGQTDTLLLSMLVLMSGPIAAGMKEGFRDFA